MTDPQPEPTTEASPARMALRQLLWEAAVVGNSQQRLPADLRHRFDAACDAIEAEALWRDFDETDDTGEVWYGPGIDDVLALLQPDTASES